MGAHCGVSFFNYADKPKKSSDAGASSRLGDYDRNTSKYTSNLEASIKSKEGTRDILMMNSNNNHHYHYIYNSNNLSSRDQKNKNLTSNYTSESNLNSSYKPSSLHPGASDLQEKLKTKKPSKKISTSKKIEDPAIPFPQSQKHHTSKFSPNDIDFVSKE